MNFWTSKNFLVVLAILLILLGIYTGYLTKSEVLGFWHDVKNILQNALQN